MRCYRTRIDHVPNDSEKLTLSPIEADLRSASRAEPRVPVATNSIHQTSNRVFICIGHEANQSQVTARADVLIYFGEQPLAVLELKRAGHAIDPSDVERLNKGFLISDARCKNDA